MRTLLTATLGPGAVVADDGVCAEAARPSFHDVYREHWHFVWRALRAHGVREADWRIRSTRCSWWFIGSWRASRGARR